MKSAKESSTSSLSETTKKQIERREVSATQNLGRCPRCNRFLIEEDVKTHECDFRDIRLRGGKEIILDHITDIGRDRNDDHVLLGWGLDAILYRLVECKHNPPHTAKRPPLTSCGKPPLDNAIECPGGGGVGSTCDQA